MWKDILKDMGVDPNDLHPVTVNKLEIADQLVLNAGGVGLRSRQVIASILCQQEPNLSLILDKPSGQKDE